MRKSLVERGWKELFAPHGTHMHSNIVKKLSLKFAVNAEDLPFHLLSKDCYTNHNKGEGSMTTKTGITDTLAFDYQFTNNWGPSDAIDPQGQGYAAWFPRSYIISYDGFNAFSQDFVYMEAEIVLKKFLLDVKKCSDKQNIFKANK